MLNYASILHTKYSRQTICESVLLQRATFPKVFTTFKNRGLRERNCSLLNKEWFDILKKSSTKSASRNSVKLAVRSIVQTIVSVLAERGLVIIQGKTPYIIWIIKTEIDDLNIQSIFFRNVIDIDINHDIHGHNSDCHNVCNITLTMVKWQKKVILPKCIATDPIGLGNETYIIIAKCRLFTNTSTCAKLWG